MQFIILKYFHVKPESFMISTWYYTINVYLETTLEVGPFKPTTIKTSSDKLI